MALVIGNSAYRNVAPLPNPVNDAAAIALMFKNAGFDNVELRRDVGIGDLRRAVREFADKSQDADIAVVFYAGHGIEVGGINYIIPVDAKLASDFDIEDETMCARSHLAGDRAGAPAAARHSRCLPRQSVRQDHEAVDRDPFGRPWPRQGRADRRPIR